MAYDEKLAARMRKLLSRKQALTERKMFGGIAFMLRGNMCCGVHGEELIVRVAPDDYPAALKRPHARTFDLTGRPMKGFVLVRPKGCAADKALRDWIALGERAADALPAKKRRPRVSHRREPRKRLARHG
jgi:TfoX/Sxy family transcriptional regulator of competence genes